MRHPVTGQVFSAGRIRVSQSEVINTFEGGEAKMGLGFAATLGWNEVKIMAGSMLDMEMGKPDAHPAHKEEFVLYHTEPVESSGFVFTTSCPTTLRLAARWTAYVAFVTALHKAATTRIATWLSSKPNPLRGC